MRRVLELLGAAIRALLGAGSWERERGRREMAAALEREVEAMAKAKARPKICPVAGCIEPVPTKHLMCKPHWSKVWLATRREVWRTLKARDIQAYRAAVALALQQAEDRG